MENSLIIVLFSVRNVSKVRYYEEMLLRRACMYYYNFYLQGCEYTPVFGRIKIGDSKGRGCQPVQSVTGI